ncbi:L-lactate dehydrogenase (quinone) large subunit LdhH [uncultured Desulfobacter sp.]|uniref:L-lactate dehydrogenase (quinone) large subunit LdhH n=1 Tax=uncultured Desulfobacter sp. TaxID=240139 RepID=UPI0029F4BAED|nr:LUD domain-containing protein [uncultured Desulfobacter sp.]
MEQKFKKSIDRAINDANLTGALANFSESYKVNRAKAYEGIDFETLRGTIAERKAYAANHLDELCAMFKTNAEKAGAKVFLTKNPADVRDYILKVAKENDVKTVVKSKSMATEEIHLNAHLEKAGISVGETDLGEWIIQLAGQRPSHMVMPAIHLTREEVADIFSKEVDERLSTDIPRLVAVAREELRTKFLKADMGISGANMAVAETGTITIVTNEGNARLVTSLPRIHVAVIGVEKIVEKFADVVPILRALPRSATAQQLTSYVTMITGQTPNEDGSMKDLHIVLMDNRRSEMAADPKFKQAMQCIRCASCLNVCPIFRLVGGHVFGKVYTGGIGTILTAWYDQLQSAEDIQGLCIQCGACKDVCPGKIDIPALIMEIRRRLVEKQGIPIAAKSIYKVVNNRRLFHSMLRTASLAGKPFAKGKFIRHLPLFLSDLTDDRSLPAIAAKPFRDVFKTIKQPECREKAVFYAGCLIDFAYPEMGEAVVKILNKAGIEVLFPENQTCCGAPARYNGAYDVAAKNAEDNIDALLENSDARYVISACPTCTVALDREFIETFESTGKHGKIEKAKQLAGKVIDFSTLVKKLVDEGRLTLKEGKELGKITYHDSCHLKRTLKANQPPRDLLTQSGFELEEMFECDTCCGMGGSYALKLPKISASILARKLTNIKTTGADVVAMDCPGCVMQIRGGLDQDGAGIKVRHTAELIAGQLK